MPERQGDASANERAYRSIRGGILDGQLPGGTMLSEAALASDLGVSRTPVRAALIRLQEEGWVTIFPQRGAQVRALSDRAVSELAHTKVLLETGSVRAAKAHARARLAQDLPPELDRQRQALHDRDLPAFIELSIAFHRAFAAASGNGVLLELYDRLADRQRFLLHSYGDQLLDRAAEIVDEHRAMIDAVAAGDDDAFAAALFHHLAETYGEAPFGH